MANRLAEDVQYVHLPERLVTGNVTDLVSGWGIAGFDVKEVPDKEDEPEAWQFVIDKLRAGLLEEADSAEFGMVRAMSNDVAKQARLSLPTEFGGPVRPSPWNEAALAGVAKKHFRKLLAARVSGNFSHNVGAVADDEEDDEAVEGDSLESMNKAQLQNEARTRELDDAGTKRDLRARIQAWDEEHAS
jgi:hypothetical protein